MLLFYEADFVKIGGIRITEGAFRYREEDYGFDACFFGGFISNFVAVIQMGQGLDHLAAVDYSLHRPAFLYAVVEHGEYDTALRDPAGDDRFYGGVR
jgi:hypothetical protein